SEGHVVETRDVEGRPPAFNEEGRRGRVKFLVDECLHTSLVAVAESRGHEARHVNWLGLSGETDWDLMPRILTEDFTFVTNNASAGISNNALRRSLSQERLTTLACIACAACCLALAFTPSLMVATIALTLGGAGWVVTWTGLDVSVQLSSPRWVVGRTLSIYSALSSGGVAVGSWIWGVVAENHSLTLALEASAGALLLVAATGFLVPIRQWKEADQDSLGFETPALALDLKSRSGPIVVKIDYCIPETNVEAFLDQMQERRRVQS
ncbi:MAG: hypothetical protein E5W15_28780, partial [Mesorhizobium sp.]